MLFSIIHIHLLINDPSLLYFLYSTDSFKLLNSGICINCFCNTVISFEKSSKALRCFSGKYIMSFEIEFLFNAFKYVTLPVFLSVNSFKILSLLLTHNILDLDCETHMLYINKVEF